MYTFPDVSLIRTYKQMCHKIHENNKLIANTYLTQNTKKWLARLSPNSRSSPNTISTVDTDVEKNAGK